jgi:hypothetical protein
VTEAGLRRLDGLPKLEKRQHEVMGGSQVKECLQRFGLVPTDADLPHIRTLLEQEVEKIPSGKGDHDLVELYCVQLFSCGLVEDVLRIWAAKQSDFDLSFQIDGELLLGAGLDATRQFLASRPNDVTAVEVLEYLESGEESSRYAYFSPEAWRQHYRRRYGVAW